MNYYFLKEDLNLLDLKISEIKKKIQAARNDKALSTTQSSETWHDNYGFEEGERQINFYTNELMKYLKIKQKDIVAPIPKNNIIGIGSIVRIKDETGKEKNIKIGSFLTFGNDSISYHSPLSNLLMGGKVGEIRKGLVGNKNKKVLILEIKNNFSRNC
jgi:transcription elongation GreA/GreB family factor